MLGGIGAYTVHADTTQDVQTTSVNQTNQVNNTNNSVTLNNNQPVAVQSSQTAQNDQSVKDNQTNQTVPSSATAAADTSNSDGLDSNIYGTVNVKDWDYQDSNNIINLTGYHGPDTQHIVVPNLNDFSKAGIKVGDRIGVGIDAETLNNMNTSYNNKNMKTLAISKTEGKFSDKVIALGSNWRYGFSNGKITNLDVSNLDTSNITDMDQMFLDASSLQKITGLEKWNTSNVQNMSSMFYGVSSLKNLTGIENWDTGNVVNMSGMFEYDSSLQSLNLEKWNVKNVKNFGSMFSDTSALMNIYGIENWNTKSATSLSGMFANATGLNKINLSNWNISKVVDVSHMFYKASNLKIIEGLENWNTENIEYMESMFYGDSNLNSIGDISKWKTGNVKDMSRMFWGTKLLTNIGNLSNWRTQNVQRMNGIFVNSGLHLIFYVANSDKKYDNKVNLIDESGNTIATIQSPTFYYQNTQSEPITVKQTVTQLILNKINELSNKHLNKVYTNLRMDNAFDSENTTDMANATYIVDVLQKVKINYIDPTGKLLKTDIVSGKIGDNVKISINLPNGYELANKNEQVPATVPVTENGIQTVIVNVKKIPVTVSGYINYIDPDGKVVKTDQVSGKVGDKVDVKLSLPDGYELANKDEQVPSTITVTENGIGTINVNVKKINTTNTGWNQQGDDWLYMQKNGYLAKGWNYLNGHWFYFDLQSGIMKTGIQSIGNSFYYLNAQHDGTYGAMKTGWQFVNGHWIGLQGSGNAYVGWQAINGHWYYFDPQTAYALTNWQDINNHWYYFDPTNAWAQTGWFKSGAGYWYFFDYANAWADTGWQKINNSWYYFDNVNANALTGWQSINSHWYYFDPTNAWARTGWQWINGHWYWFDEANAWALTGWQYYGGQWYFMDQQNAWMDTGWTTNLANGQLYYLDKNGHPLTGWQRSLNGFWYYLQPGSDAAAIGWNWINGHWYYFNPEETINGIKAKGAMFTGRHFIDNRWNRFDLNGHWLGYEN